MFVQMKCGARHINSFLVPNAENCIGIIEL